MYAEYRVKLNICCWNVRTLLDRNSSKRPERRTALVTKELQRLNVDIAALAETRLAGEDQLIEVSSGFTIFWVGKPKTKRREGGVGFAIRTSLLDRIKFPSSVNDRIMKMRMPLTHDRHATLLSIYAPTLQASEDVLDSFYECLRSTIATTPAGDKLLILGVLMPV